MKYFVVYFSAVIQKTNFKHSFKALRDFTRFLVVVVAVAFLAFSVSGKFVCSLCCCCTRVVAAAACVAAAAAAVASSIQR